MKGTAGRSMLSPLPANMFKRGSVNTLLGGLPGFVSNTGDSCGSTGAWM